MTTVITVTKNVIKRAWNDLEPKVIAFLATGLTVSGLLWAADYVGIHVTQAQAGLAVLVISGIAGYVKSSTTTVLPVTPVTPAVALVAAPVAAPVIGVDTGIPTAAPVAVAAVVQDVIATPVA